MKNYRPESLLCVSGMILERAVALQIEKYFEKNKYLGEFQFGFRNKFSKVSEILDLFDTLYEAKDQKKNAIVVLYDLSSAFDTLCHETLLTKLQMYGLTRHSVKWISSYLENRKQMVTVGGEVSSTQHITLGTPQR